MKGKVKIIIVAIWLYLNSFQIVVADGLDKAGEALKEILYTGFIMLLLIIFSLVVISNLRLNSILKTFLIIWTFYTPLVYINDPKPYSFNIDASLGDLIIHPYGWAIISITLLILTIWNNKEKNNHEDYMDENEIDVGKDI